MDSHTNPGETRIAPLATLTELRTTAVNHLKTALERTKAEGSVSLEVAAILRQIIRNIMPLGPVPGTAFLFEMLDLYLEDGVLAADEATTLFRAIERTLADLEKPARAQAPWFAADRTTRDLLRNERRDNPATKPQRSFIRRMGAVCPRSCSFFEASDMIDELLRNRPPCPTPRQMMVLRFWNRLEMATASVAEVSAWMDTFCDRNRRAAWTLWKLDHKDRGGQSQANVDRVEIGIGSSYLERLTLFDESTIETLAKVNQRSPRR